MKLGGKWENRIHKGKRRERKKGKRKSRPKGGKGGGAISPITGSRDLDKHKREERTEYPNRGSEG